ncbi:MAG TPA: hypothetical protein VKP11_08570 [Frankiaceae bacterium]|nr:hypothetical protein [Frankiaceae bacterium]
MRVFLVVLAALLLAAAVAGLARLPRGRVERARWSCGGVAAVEVRLGAGRVEVLGQRRGDVRVETAARCGPRAARPVVAVAGGVLRVDARRAAARCQLRVPERTPVRAEVRDGEITLWGAAGDLVLLTEAGTIAGHDLGGERVTARSGTGAVSLGFGRPPRRVTARSGTGQVRVVLPGGPYAVEVDAGAPDVRVDLPVDPAAGRTVVASSRAGPVRVLAASPQGPVRL